MRCRSRVERGLHGDAGQVRTLGGPGARCRGGQIGLVAAGRALDLDVESPSGSGAAGASLSMVVIGAERKRYGLVSTPSLVNTA